MRKVCAFIDESGAFGWELSNPSVSTCFVITAIVVEECYIELVMTSVERIRKNIFKKGK